MSRIYNSEGNFAKNYIQLFRERLSVKAYATVPKGFMDNNCLPLSDRISQCFSPQEGERLTNSNWHYPEIHSALARTLLPTTLLETAIHPNIKSIKFYNMNIFRTRKEIMCETLLTQ